MAIGLRELKDKGTELLAKGRLELALGEFRKALALAPQDAALRQKVAEILGKLGRIPEAIVEYEELAGRFANEGQLLRAIALCKVILQLDPAHTHARTRLVEYHQARGDVLDGPPAAPSAPPPASPPKAAAAAPIPFTPRMAPVAASAPARPAPPVAAPAAPPAPEGPIPAASLARIPLFSDLSADAFRLVFDLVQVREVKTGEVIITEGEQGRSVFAIVSGAVDVEHSQEGAPGLPLARLEAGEFFGEMALVANVPRLATVRAAEETTLLELPRDALLELARRHPHIDGVLERFHKQRLLANLLVSNPFFSAFEERERMQLVDRFRVRTFEPGDVLIEQGRPGVAFYVLLRGRCNVATELAPGISEPFPDLEEGDVYGEIALLQDRPSTASVRAATRCVVLGLHKRVFEEFLVKRPAVMQHLSALAEERLRRMGGEVGDIPATFRARAV